jgi:hypothetical protein
MYKIARINTTSNDYEIVSSDDKRYKTIDCSCNCLGDKSRVDKYRKQIHLLKM